METNNNLCTVAEIEEPNLLDTSAGTYGMQHSSVLDSEEDDCDSDDHEEDDELGPLKGVKPEKARWSDAEVSCVSVLLFFYI